MNSELFKTESISFLFQQAPVAIAYLKGPKLEIEVANAQILELWGKHSDIIGLPIIEGLPEIAGQPFPKMLEDVFKTGLEKRGYETAAKLVRRGYLEEGFFNFIYAPVKDEEGVITGVSVVATEVTEQVRAKRQLVESERRFRGLVSDADVATGVYLGMEMRIDIANDAMLKVWGKDSSVIGKTLKEALPELEGQPFHDLLQKVYTTGVTYKATEDPVDLVVDGKLQTFYYNFSYKALRNADGEIYGILNMAVNVTEQVLSRKRIEENEAKLRESQQQLTELADSMPQIVWTANSDGSLEYYNQQWHDFIGLATDDHEHKNWEALIHPEDSERVRQAWFESVQTGNKYEVEYRFKDRFNEGSYRWFLGRAVPIRNDQGQITRWIGTNTDINEFKMLQRQKDNFLGIASHELKTPVTSLKAYTQVLEVLLKKQGDDKKAELVHKMDLQLNKLTSLIRDLLDVTKIQSGKMQLNDAPFEFKELVEETIEELQRTTRHQLVADLEFEGIVYADRDRIGQVITNLISNAIKYSPGADKVNVYTRDEGDKVILCVRDFGIGIPENKRDRMFEQFYRVIGNKGHSFPGLGLGLFISSDIITREGGEIWFTSEEGKGSVFCFSLPRMSVATD